MLDDRTILVLDEVNFLKDMDVLYHLLNSTKVCLVLLTQHFRWYENLGDPSVQSRLQAEHVVFSDYTVQQLNEILKARAETGLNKFSEAGVADLASIVFDRYRSDVRIAILALNYLGRKGEWDQETMSNAARYASMKVESKTLKTLSDKDLLILEALLKFKDTNKAFEAVTKSNGASKISKATFLRAATHLQNLKIILLVRKRVGRSFVLEADPPHLGPRR